MRKQDYLNAHGLEQLPQEQVKSIAGQVKDALSPGTYVRGYLDESGVFIAEEVGTVTTDADGNQYFYSRSEVN